MMRLEYIGCNQWFDAPKSFVIFKHIIDVQILILSIGELHQKDFPVWGPPL